MKFEVTSFMDVPSEMYVILGDLLDQNLFYPGFFLEITAVLEPIVSKLLMLA